MDNQEIQRLAAYLLEAQDTHQEIDRLTTAMCPTLTIEDAYLVQAALIRIRQGRGETIAGPKMGLTSPVKLKQMHVTEPVYGYVFTSMVAPNGGSVQYGDFIHPKAEPEIGFILERELQGPGATMEDVLDATQSVFAGIEIIDSRYRNYDFTLPDVIADNTSAAGAILGNPIPFKHSIDLAACKATLSVNGKAIGRGEGSAVLGHPANAVARLANMLAGRKKPFPPGSQFSQVVLQPLPHSKQATIYLFPLQALARLPSQQYEFGPRWRTRPLFTA